MLKFFSREEPKVAYAARVDGLFRGSWDTPVPAGGMNEERGGADNSG